MCSHPRFHLVPADPGIQAVSYVSYFPLSRIDAHGIVHVIGVLGWPAASLVPIASDWFTSASGQSICTGISWLSSFDSWGLWYGLNWLWWNNPLYLKFRSDMVHVAFSYFWEMIKDPSYSVRNFAVNPCSAFNRLQTFTRTWSPTLYQWSKLPWLKLYSLREVSGQHIIFGEQNKY